MFSSGALQFAFNLLRQIKHDEVFGGIEIIFALIVYHAEIVGFRGAFVGNHFVDHARSKQICVVTSNADRALR